MIDYVMRISLRRTHDVGLTIHEKKSNRIRKVVISDLDYADDIVLLSDNLDDAQLLLSTVEEVAEQIGLVINHKKTEFIALGSILDELLNDVSKGLFLKAGPIECVEDFKYLGSWVMSSSKDISVRIPLAWAAAKKLNRIWKSHLDRKLKVSFFQAVIQSILLYGCETWSLTKTLNRRLDGAYTRLLRFALDIPWEDHIKNTAVYDKLPKISKVIRQRRLRYAGHCMRSTQIVSKLVLWEQSGTFRRGGHLVKSFPRVLYDDLISTGLISSELEISQIFELAQDREKWKHLITSLPT
jgi:hypothetical protein